MVTKPKTKAKPKTKEVAVKEDVGKSIVPGGSFSQQQVSLIKNTIAKDATEDELMMFIGQCSRTGLDPFQKQIYFIKSGGRVMTQVAIDGYRLIAERSGNYAGQDEPVFEYDEHKRLVLAKVSVYKWHGDTRYQAAVGVAHLNEYKKQTPTWKSMEHTMLSKVAEAIGLRKAFPNDLQKIYIAEEVMAAGLAPKLEIEDDSIETEATEVVPEEPEIIPIDDGTRQQQQPGAEIPPTPDDFLKPDGETEAKTPSVEEEFATNGKVLEAKALWLQLMSDMKVGDKESKIKMAKTLMSNYKKAVLEKLTATEVNDFIEKTKSAIAKPAGKPEAVTPEVVTQAEGEKVLTCGTCEAMAGEQSDPENYEAMDRTGWCKKCCDGIK